MQTKEFEIEFGPLEFEQTGQSWKIEHLLGVQAELRITIDGRNWFSEPMFPVVELAAAANSWLNTGGDFLFETMEAEESPFLWVRETAQGCLVGAAWRSFSFDEPLSCPVLRQAFSGFVSEVILSAKEQLGVDVTDIVYERTT